MKNKMSNGVRCHRLTGLMACVVLVSFLGSCGALKKFRSNSGEEESIDPRDEFALAEPKGDWEKSRFCPTEEKKVPEEVVKETRFENDFISSKLANDGLTGWMHGVVPHYKEYVFTYRSEDKTDEMAFFKAQQFSLIPASEEVAKMLPQLHRHDKVKLFGAIAKNGSAIVHLKISKIEVLKKFASPTKNDYSSFDEKVFENRDKARIFGMIHALTHSEELGWAAVLETKGILLPIAIDKSHNETAAKLYRGDIVSVDVNIIRRANGPLHLVTDQEEKNAIIVVDAMVNCHGEKRVIEGTLVKFDKSPAISTDVYAVRFVDANDQARNFTFFPDKSKLDEEGFVKVFMDVSAKAKKIWDSAKQEPIERRNFREKTTIKVTAFGVLNVVSTEQANAQIYIESADQIRLEEVSSK